MALLKIYLLIDQYNKDLLKRATNHLIMIPTELMLLLFLFEGRTFSQLYTINYHIVLIFEIIGNRIHSQSITIKIFTKISIFLINFLKKQLK